MSRSTSSLGAYARRLDVSSHPCCFARISRSNRILTADLSGLIPVKSVFKFLFDRKQYATGGHRHCRRCWLMSSFSPASLGLSWADSSDSASAPPPAAPGLPASLTSDSSTTDSLMKGLTPLLMITGWNGVLIGYTDSVGERIGLAPARVALRVF